MNAITALIAGLLAGWLIEWIMDWILWRRRQAELRSQLDRAYIKLGSADAASHALEHQLETLKGEHAALQGKYNSLAARIADTQPRTAVEKPDEGETWVETAPAEEWVAEATGLPPSTAPAASEPPQDALPLEPALPEAPSAPAEDLAAIPAQEAEPPSEPIPPEPAEPVAPAPAVPAEAAQPEPAIPAPAKSAIPPQPGETAPGDNLRAIKGVGPAIDYKLRQAGIHTYKDLAESTPERVADAIGNTFLRLVNVDALIEQARHLAAGQNGGGQA